MSILNFIGQHGNLKLKGMQYGTQYEGIAVHQWDGTTGKKANIYGIYLHPSGMPSATPDRLLGEECVLEEKTLPKVAKNGITLELHIRDNERLQDCHIYWKR